MARGWVITFTEPERLKPEEFSFLISREKYHLIDKIGLIERRGANYNYLLGSYSSMHNSLQDWLDGLPGFNRTMDGPVAVDEFLIAFQPRFDARAGQLNRVLVGIIENLDGDLDMAEGVIQAFADAAHEEYGSLFPKIKIEIEAKRS